MHNVRFGEICELSYLQSTGPCLPHLVRQLSDRLLAMGSMDLNLTWDCDDIAVFDLPGHRIILATAECLHAGGASRLLVSVGPGVEAAQDRGTRLGHTALCRRIIRGIERKHPADKRQNRSWPGILTPERVDDMLYSMTPIASQSKNLREFAAPLRSAVLAEDQKLRAALASTNHWRRRQMMAAGLLINGLTWSMATAAPVLVLAVFGSNMIGALMWATTAQLPR